MNTKGIKFLAVLAVLAMAFAAFAVIAPAEENDAAASKWMVADADVPVSEVPATGEAWGAGPYIATTNVTIDAPTAAKTLYIKDGVTVTIKGIAEANALTIKAALSTSTTTTAKVIKGTTEAEGDSVDATISVTATTDSTKTIIVKAIAGAVGTADTDGNRGTISSFEVSGTMASFSFTKSTATGMNPIPGNTCTVTALLDTAAVAVGAADISCGASVQSGATYKFYPAGASVPDVTVADDTATIVSLYDATASVESTIETKTGKVTATGIKDGSAALVITINDEIPAISGKLKTGVVEVVSGNATITDDGFAKDANATGYVQALSTDIATHTYTLSPLKTESLSNTVKNIYDGRLNTDLGSMDANKQVQGMVGTYLYVPEGVSIYEKNWVLAGTNNVILFGNIKIGAGAAFDYDAGKVVIGPKAYIEDVIVTAGTANVVNSLTGAGDDPEIKNIPTSDTVSNAILAGDLEIPEGTSLTVTGSLGLNGYRLTVNGELIVSNGAYIYATGTYHAGEFEGIILGADGEIINYGNIGFGIPVIVKNALDQQVGILGIAPEYLTLVRERVGEEYVNNMAVGGTARILPSAVESVLALNGAKIAADMVIPANATLYLAANTELAQSTELIINGTIASGGAVELTMKNGSSVTINGVSGNNVTFKGETGKIGDNNTITPDAVAPSVTQTTATGFIKGLTLAIGRESVSVSGVTTVYQRMYIEGETSVGAIGNAVNPTTTLTFAGVLYVKAGTTLSFVSGVTTAAGTLNISGEVIKVNSNINTTEFVGVAYTKTVSAITTYYYTNLSDAMDEIAEADSKTLTAKITTIPSDITIEVGQVVNFNATDVGSSATVTVEGTATGIAKIKGILIVASGATCNTPTEYDVKTTLIDNSVVYSSIAKAISSAEPGSTITVGTATTDSLSVPAGVTVEIVDSLTITKNLSVAATGEIVLKGGASLIDNANTDSYAIDIAGYIDASKGTFTNKAGPSFSVTGALIVAALPTNFEGAYYTDSTGAIVITTISQAVLGSMLNDFVDVSIKGTVSDADEIYASGIKIVPLAGSKVTFSSITLDTASIEPAADAVLSGNISMVTGADSTSVVVLKKASNIKLIDSKTTDASGVDTYSAKIDEATDADIAGDVQISSGKVSVNGALVFAGKFTVSDNGVLTISGDGKSVTIKAAAEAVFGGKTTVTNSGILNLTANAAKPVKVTGEIVVTATKSVKGTLNMTNVLITGSIDATEGNSVAIKTDAPKIMMGVEPTSLGATGSFAGNIALENAVAFIVFPGFNISSMTVDMVGEDDSAVFTAMEINGKVFMVVVSSSTHTGEIDDVLGFPAYKISGLDAEELALLPTPAGWGLADHTDAGSVEVVDAKLTSATATVIYSAGTGISMFVDGVKIETGKDAEKAVGTHTVSITIDPGYKGTATVTFNGKAVTSSFEITSDMAGKEFVLSATGDITIDNPEPTPAEKEAFGITEILLVVLIILIAVMVIVVIMRMNRS